MREKASQFYCRAIIAIMVSLACIIAFFLTAALTALAAMTMILAVLTVALSSSSVFIALYVFYDHRASRNEQGEDIPA